jgi:hypothetical protein
MYKKACFLIFFSVCAFMAGGLYPYVKTVYYLLQFKADNLTNKTLLGTFTNILISEFAKKNYVLLDGLNPGPYGEEPDYIMNGVLSFQGDSYLILFRGENMTNKKDRWEDTVYTYDVLTGEGFREASAALAFRTDIFRKGRVPEAYRERTDYEKKYGRAFTSKFTNHLDHIEILDFVSISAVYPNGYDMGIPIKFGLDFFEYDYIWAFHPTTFGIGAGAKIFAYKGPTAMSFLPLMVRVPLFIFPDNYDYNRKDLYFVAEGGFFIPQYSYIDLSFKLLFNGISISVGCIYLPYFSNETAVRPEYWTFYGGVTFFFGKYGVKWE